MLEAIRDGRANRGLPPRTVGFQPAEAVNWIVDAPTKPPAPLGPSPPNYQLDPNSPPKLTAEELQAFKSRWRATYGWEPRLHEIGWHRAARYWRRLWELAGLPVAECAW